MNSTVTKTKVTDSQRRCFFGLIRRLGWDKEEAYAFLGISSIRQVSAYKMASLLDTLQAAANGAPQPKKTQWLTDEELRSEWEAWRQRFFPPVLVFGVSRGDRAPSVKQQDFIIYLAHLLFRGADEFSTWLKNNRGISGDQVRTSKEANLVIRGLQPWAERKGYNVAPPEGTDERRIWDAWRERKEAI